MFLRALLPQLRQYSGQFSSLCKLWSPKNMQNHVYRTFNNLNLMVHPAPSLFFSTTMRRSKTLIEPDDVGLPPEIPEYDKLAIKINGYDFTVLEKFTKYVHSVVRSMQFNTECYPMPSKSIHVNTYRPNSTIIDKSYNLQKYERVVVINDLPNTKLTPLISLLTLHTPEGINLIIDHPSPSEEESRYIPDRQLVELQNQLEEIAIAKKKKK